MNAIKIITLFVVSFSLASCSETATDPMTTTEPAISTKLSPREDTVALGYKRDDELRLNHLQMIGTHNSYHISNDNGIDEHEYTHDALDVQLDQHGVRKFELDVYHYEQAPQWQVTHIPDVDPLSTCATLQVCLGLIKGWSDKHPGHHPLVIMVEVKAPLLGSADPATQVAALDTLLRNAIPAAQLITPDHVQGDHPTLRAAVTTDGWPTLANSRGKMLFFMQADEAMTDAYTREGTDITGRVMFPDVPADHPMAALMAINDPFDGFDEIQRRVKEGFIVRTRADAALGQGTPEPGRLQRAINSGAHILSTDWPAPNQHPEGYYAALTDGTPSLCNPVAAPTNCQPADIEDPEKLSK